MPNVHAWVVCVHSGKFLTSRLRWLDTRAKPSLQFASKVRQKGTCSPWEIFKVLACKRHFLHFLNCFITSVNIQFTKCKTVASHLNISRSSSFFLWSRKMAENEGRRLSESLSYIIPWRSGSAWKSVAKNMADFGLCWRHLVPTATGIYP